jgi:nucleoside-diphosphate-sugar epimerase
LPVLPFADIRKQFGDLRIELAGTLVIYLRLRRILWARVDHSEAFGRLLEAPLSFLEALLRRDPGLRQARQRVVQLLLPFGQRLNRREGTAHGLFQTARVLVRSFRHYATIVAIMHKVAIFGAAGPIGRYVGMALDRRGIPFRAVGRTAGKLQAAFGTLPHAEVVAADLSDLGAATQAARGVDTIVYTLGVPYTEFQSYPKLMRVAVEAAAAAGVRRFVLVTGVYSYGVPQTQRVAETHPRVPVAVKGQLRKEQEDILLDADARGLFKSLLVRLPDFYGPFADNSLANPIFHAALAGKTANWLGPVAPLHEFVFVPDAGPVIVELAARDDCYGEAWNFAGPGDISALAFIQKIYQAAGHEPKFRSAGRTSLRLMGWVKPLMRELPEMLYLQETPVLLDDSKLRAKLGQVQKTTYDKGIQRTLDWIVAQAPSLPR